MGNPRKYTRTKTAYVYGLIDPRTNVCRYVGVTIDLKTRVAAHVDNKEIYVVNKQKSEWLQGLIAEGLRPIVNILDIVPPGVDAVEAERRWIRALIKNGVPLLNIKLPPKPVMCPHCGGRLDRYGKAA